MDRGAWRATVHGVARVGSDLVTKQPHMCIDLFLATLSLHRHTGTLLAACGSAWASHAVASVADLSLNTCGAQAWLPCVMWDLPRLGIEPVSIQYIGRCILNHWTTREVPEVFLFKQLNIG